MVNMHFFEIGADRWSLLTRLDGLCKIRGTKNYRFAFFEFVMKQVSEIMALMRIVCIGVERGTEG